MLSFLAGIAGGMSEDIDRKRALADKKDLASEQLENQIKLMTEQTAINDRQYEARKKLEKSERVAKNINFYSAMNIPQGAAEYFGKTDNDDIKAMIVNRAEKFPDTDWNTIIQMADETGEGVEGIIDPSFRFTESLFKKPPKKYDTVMENVEASKVLLAQAEIAGDENGMTKYKTELDLFSKQLVPNSDDDIDLEKKLAGFASTRMSAILGSQYTTATASGNIMTAIRGEYFQYATKYDMYMKDTETFLSNKKDLTGVQNFFEANKQTQQRTINAAIQDIEMTVGTSAAKNKVVTLNIPSSVHENGGQAIAKYIEDNIASKPIKLNDVLQYNLMLPPEQQTPDRKSAGAKKGLWGGSYQKSFTDTGFKFEYTAM